MTVIEKPSLDRHSILDRIAAAKQPDPYPHQSAALSSIAIRL